MSANTFAITANCPSLISGGRNESKWPNWVSNPGPLALESDTPPTAPSGLAGPSGNKKKTLILNKILNHYAWPAQSGPIRPVSVRSGKKRTRMVTN